MDSHASYFHFHLKHPIKFIDVKTGELAAGRELAGEQISVKNGGDSKKNVSKLFLLLLEGIIGQRLPLSIE